MQFHKSRRNGFTLTELLVVIVIIAALSSLVFMMGSRALKKADGVRSISNMRQIGTMLGAYASDNSNRLPAPRADIPLPNGSFQQLHWFETLVQLTDSSLEPKDWQSIEWWRNTEPILRNPIIDGTPGPAKDNWWNPGYAFNRQMIVNIAPEGMSRSWAPGENGPQSYAIPLAKIRDPSRTPIIAPRKQWHFTFKPSELKDPNLEPFKIDGKLNVLFVDGHVEAIRPDEYTQRKLHEMPR